MSLRVRAFLIHLAISLVVVALSLSLVYFVWYPSPLHEALQVTHVFLVLMGVDVVLGPLMTLIVYRPEKKYLKLDIFVIAVLQALAFGYGFLTVMEARPVWLVFNKDRFDLVRAYEIDARRLDKAAPEYRAPSLLGPLWVAASPPDDVEARNDLLFESISGRADVPQRPDLYYPLGRDVSLIKEKAFPLVDLNKYNPSEVVDQRLSEYPGANGWLPLNSPRGSMVVLVEKGSGSVLGIVDLAPWD